MFEESNVIYRYKYLPFNEGSLKTISEGTIKFTCPLEFNDPFDCSPFYDTTNLIQITSIRKDLFRDAAERKGLTPAQRIQKKPEMVARLRKGIEDGSLGTAQMKRVGVVSLSKNALSILMWSHYAQYHQGFVLELRIPVRGKQTDIPYISDRLLPFPVIYQPKRPVVNMSQYDKEELLHKILLTKSELWSYEQEERVITENRVAGIYPYRRDEILCSVIAGMRMTEENKQTLAAECAKLQYSKIPSLRLYHAMPSKREFALHVPDHPRLAS